MLNNKEIELNILNRKNFLYGQLELYKIEFSETGHNKYLEVMNELNKTIELIDFLKNNSILLSRKIVESKNKEIL